MLHLVQSEQGYVTPDGIAFCADILGPDQGPGRGGRDVLHDVQAHADRRVPRQRLHQHAVRHARRRRDLRRAQGRARRRQQRDHRRRHDHPRARRVPGRLRLRAGRHRQLRVLRQPDRRVSARELVSQLRSGERPRPTRGAPLCSFKQIERQIAGFFDDADASRSRPSAAAPPTEAGVKLAIERGETAPSYAVERPGRRRPRRGRRRAPTTVPAAATPRRRPGATRRRPERDARPLRTTPHESRPRRRHARAAIRRRGPTPTPEGGADDASDPRPDQALRHRPAVEDRQLRAPRRLRRAAQGADPAAGRPDRRWSRTPTCAAAAAPASRPA